MEKGGATQMSIDYMLKKLCDESLREVLKSPEPDKVDNVKRLLVGLNPVKHDPLPNELSTIQPIPMFLTPDKYYLFTGTNGMVGRLVSAFIPEIPDNVYLFLADDLVTMNISTSLTNICPSLISKLPAYVTLDVLEQAGRVRDLFIVSCPKNFKELPFITNGDFCLNLKSYFFLRIKLGYLLLTSWDNEA